MFDFKEYYEAKSIDGALDYLSQNADAKLIAGGTDVLIRIRENKLKDANLVGISFIDEIKKIFLDDAGNIHIGPMITFAKLESNDIIKENIPYLGSAGGTMGGPQIRNVATIGGNVCNGATSGDSATTLFCLNAKLKIQSAEAEKIVDIKDFYLGPGRVDLKQNEMLTDIIIERQEYDGYVGKYMKFAQRNAMDIATLGCAVVLKTDGKVIEDIRIACGVAAPTPVRCIDAENIGKGMAVNAAEIDQMAKATISNTKARDSWRGSKDFREHLVYELTKRGTMMLCGLEYE